MDYSDLVTASEKADLAYAQWYAGLPNERKAQFFLSGFDFVAEKIRYEARGENPFITEAEIVLKFVELTQKDDYPEPTFQFIREQFARRSDKEWKMRFKAMKKSLGWNYQEIAQFMEAGSGDSIKASVNRKLPAFAKLAVCVFEQMRK